MKYLRVVPYYQVAECECGGYFHKRAGYTEHLTSPPQAYFVCDNCGKIKRLPEQQWPQVKFHVQKDSPISEEEMGFDG